MRMRSLHPETLYTITVFNRQGFRDVRAHRGPAIAIANYLGILAPPHMLALMDAVMIERNMPCFNACRVVFNQFGMQKSLPSSCGSKVQHGSGDGVHSGTRHRTGPNHMARQIGS